MAVVIRGQLEIDQERGTIWFNDDEAQCRLRIYGLPAPIPNPVRVHKSQVSNESDELAAVGLLDVNLVDGIRVSWKRKANK